MPFHSFVPKATEFRSRAEEIHPSSMIHACFYGGGSGSRVTRSVGVIRDLTKTMKAMTLKVKRGERHARARRRRRRAKAEDDADLDHQDNDAPSSASSSAKIAPAQPHEEEHGASEKTKRRHCDKCCSPLEDDDDHVAAAAAEEEEKEQGGSDGEWMAEPEPGVLMTLAPRGDGANYLRRIRFGEEHFPDARAARAWWEENFDRIVELYSVVVQPEHGDEDDDDCCDDPAAPVTPCQSEDDEHQRPDGELEYSASCSASGGSTSNFSGPSSGSGSGSGNKADSPILGLVTEPNSSKRSKPSRRNQKTGQEQ